MALSKRIVHQTLACSSVIYLQFILGLGYGWVAPTLGKFKQFNITAEQISWLASVNEVGKFCGPLIGPWLADHFGRRYTLFLVTVSYCLIWTSVIFVRNFALLCVIRVTLGLANSINDVADCAYIAENSSPSYRAIVGSALTLTYYGAVFVENAVATYLSYTNTAIVNSALAGCALLTLYYCTETPYFLVMKGEHKRAKKNLTWLLGDETRDQVADELRKIEHSIEEEKEKKKSLKLLFSSPANVRGILLAVSTHIVGTACGGGAIGPYASVIFSPTDRVSSNEFTVMYGFMAVITAAVSPFIVEKVDRRVMFLGCYAATVCSHLCSFLLMYFHNAGYPVPHYPWLIFASISTYSLCTGLKMPVGYAMKGELLPFSVRAIGSGLCAMGQSLTAFWVAKMFVPIAENFGMETNFLMYFFVGLTGTVLYYYVLPETRGKTLHELQNMHKREPIKLDDMDQERMREKLMS